jgi:membrane-associated phospholipid phosphatase
MSSPFALPRPGTESLRPVGGVSPLVRPLALDIIILTYALFTVTVVIAGAAAIPHAERVVMAHLAGLLVYALLRWGATDGIAFRFLFFLSLIGLVVGIFEGIGVILPYIHANDVAVMKADGILAQLDVRLFGSDPTTWFTPLLTPVTVTVLQICYTSYYFLFVIVVVVVLARHRYRSFLSWSAVITGCFFTTYLGYYFVPAYGPRIHNHYEVLLPHTDVSRAIYGAIDSLDLIRLNAFPSGHTAVTLVYLAILFHENRKAAWIFLPLVVGLVVATVALRYHYLVDVVAGILVAALWIPWGARAVFHFDHQRHAPDRPAG